MAAFRHAGIDVSDVEQRDDPPAEAPDARIVYVDNDPLVLVHARALLTNTTPEGVTAYVDADSHSPDQILADASNVLNFNLPIAVMFMGVLGHVSDDDEVLSIVFRVMAGVPSGSYLVLWDSTNTSEGFHEAQQGYDNAVAVDGYGAVGRKP